MWQGGVRFGARPRLLVCMDLQQGSVAEGQGPDGCIVNCRRVLAYARDEGWQIVHVHRKSEPPLARPISGLEPLLTEPVLYRTALSPFSNRSFRDLVDAAGAAHMVVIGYSVTQSFLATALIAYDEDLSVVLVEDAIGSGALDHETRDAIGVLGQRVASPFLVLTTTDALVGGPRLRRVV